MNSQWFWTRLIAVLVLLGACSKATEPDKLPPPSATANASVYGFAVAAQYTADVVLPDKIHTRRIVLTIGQPTNLVKHLKEKPCAVEPQPEDVAIPYHLSVVNTSSDNNSPAMVFASLSAALDVAKFTQSLIYTQYSGGRICTLVFPGVGATGRALVKNEIWAWTIGNNPLNTPGIDDRGTLFIVSSNGKPSPAESIFLRITPVDPTVAVQYTVTKLTSTVPSRAAGRVTAGPTVGAYYVPLGNTTPCGTFAGEVPMQCGTTLP